MARLASTSVPICLIWFLWFLGSSIVHAAAAADRAGREFTNDREVSFLVIPYTGKRQPERENRGKLGSSGALKEVIDAIASGDTSIGQSVGPDNSGESYGGNYYWVGNRYYKGTSPGMVKCVVQTPSDFPVTYADTEKRVEEVIYECKNNQYCCDSICCGSALSTGAIVGIVIAIIGVPGMIIGYICCCRISARAAKRKNRTHEDIETVGTAKDSHPYYGTVGHEPQPYSGAAGAFPSPETPQNPPPYVYR